MSIYLGSFILMAIAVWMMAKKRNWSGWTFTTVLLIFESLGAVLFHVGREMR